MFIIAYRPSDKIKNFRPSICHQLSDPFETSYGCQFRMSYGYKNVVSFRDDIGISFVKPSDILLGYPAHPKWTDVGHPMDSFVLVG